MKRQNSTWIFEDGLNKIDASTGIYERCNTRYILGEVFSDNNNTLICIGVNPSTAMPNKLDKTLQRVRHYALKKGYGAWYMLNVYPQRATNPNDMDKEININIHRENLSHIKRLLSLITKADVWIAWGDIIKKRSYLEDIIFGNQNTDSILDLFAEGEYSFYSIGFTSKHKNPMHPLNSSRDRFSELRELSNDCNERLKEHIKRLKINSKN